MSRARELLDRLGMPDAVSWPAFWATLFANALVSLATGLDVQASWAQRLAVLVLSQAGAFGFLLLFRVTVLDRSRGVPRPWSTLGAFIAAGALRGLIAGSLLISWSGANPSVLRYRIAAGIALFVVVLVPTALIVSTARSYRRTRRSLLARGSQLREAQARVIEEIEERDVHAVARVQANLAQALMADAPEEQARRLEQVAAEVVRPLSHELAQSMEAWQPPPENDFKVRLIAIVERATTGRPLMPLATSMAGALMFMGYALDRVGLWVVVGVLVFGAISWTGLWLGNRLLSALLRQGPLALRLLVVLIVLALVGLLMGAVMDVMLGDYRRANLLLAVPVLYCLFGMTLALARAGDEELRLSIAELRRTDVDLTWQLKRLNMQQWCQQRRLSRALHGPVQSTIAASVERLRAGDQADAAHMRGEILAALSLLNGDADEVWSSGVKRLKATWRRICEVRVAESSHGLDADPACAEMALEIVAEAVSNAVRHGHARSVDVAFSWESRAVEITVTDDGGGVTGSGEGLGTRLMEDCTLTWSRTSRDGFTTLRATLPSQV